MVLDKKTEKITNRNFYDIIDFLSPSDVLVVNDTKVIPARIFGKDTKIREILLIKERQQNSVVGHLYHLKMKL